MFKAIRVRYEKGVLKPLEPVELKEGEEVRARIERSLRERLKDLIGILGRSDEGELERYLEEAWLSRFSWALTYSIISSTTRLKQTKS